MRCEYDVGAEARPALIMLKALSPPELDTIVAWGALNYTDS